MPSKRSSNASDETPPAKRVPKAATFGTMNKATLAAFCYFLERMKNRVESDTVQEVVKLRAENEQMRAMLDAYGMGLLPVLSSDDSEAVSPGSGMGSSAGTEWDESMLFG